MQYMYVRCYTKIKQMFRFITPFSDGDQCPPIETSPVVVLEKLEDVFGP